MTSVRYLAAALLGIAALPAPALAEPPAQIRFLRGTIVTAKPNELGIKTREGKMETVKLAPDWTVSVTKPIQVSEIKSGSFIGTAEMPQKDGTGRALEVHVFPPGVKIGEGHYDWGLKKGSKMTNGTVGKIAATPKGRALQVSYPTGNRSITVPPNVPVVQIVPGTRAMAKVGTRVFIGAMPTAGGLVSNSVQVGVNGSAPPM